MNLITRLLDLIEEWTGIHWFDLLGCAIAAGCVAWLLWAIIVK